MNPGTLALTGGMSASLMGLTSKNSYVKGVGALGLFGTADAAFISAVTGMPMMQALATVFTNPITAAIGGAIIGGIALYKHFTDPSRKAVIEAGRDFGISITKGTWDAWTEGLGFTSESQWKGIRKDLMSSPL